MLPVMLVRPKQADQRMERAIADLACAIANAGKKWAVGNIKADQVTNEMCRFDAGRTQQRHIPLL